MRPVRSTIRRLSKLQKLVFFYRPFFIRPRGLLRFERIAKLRLYLKKMACSDDILLEMEIHRKVVKRIVDRKCNKIAQFLVANEEFLQMTLLPEEKTRLEQCGTDKNLFYFQQIAINFDRKRWQVFIETLHKTLQVDLEELIKFLYNEYKKEVKNM